eukprot:TRINITY_DN3203_c0_g1_i1.p1 TRINITY_DN3203_c0_g1~~TRINITY_DN3203_c0_g1_i1.p1  ORF type:complete len:213 (+),score=43.50 TRINITY_DN3203_c0_g1_i1:176-814(+)
MTTLTEEMVRKASGQFDLSSVGVLQLTKLEIVSIEKGVLDECAHLHTLDLAHNEIRDCSGLGNCPELKFLDLSNNKITNLIGVELPASLEELRLEGNQVSSADDIKMLKQLPKLKALYLTSADGKTMNPVCVGNSEYPAAILEMLPHLKNLDGMRLGAGGYWPEPPAKPKPIKFPEPEPWPDTGMSSDGAQLECMPSQDLSLIHISEPTRPY